MTNVVRITTLESGANAKPPRKNFTTGKTGPSTTLPRCRWLSRWLFSSCEALPPALKRNEPQTLIQGLRNRMKRAIERGNPKKWPETLERLLTLQEWIVEAEGRL